MSGALYVVTGGAGFIGSHLCDALLAAGHRVRVLDDFSTGRAENLDPCCEVVRGDVADPRAVLAALAGAAGCYHLAAIASVQRCNEDWLQTHRVNQGGTVSVLDAARALGGLPVVYASSAAVYGDLGERAAREDICAAPLTAYGADKLGSELHATAAFLVHGVPTLGLRFFNVYGPRQDPFSPYSGVISIFARRLTEGMPITLHGDGEQTRDFVHVRDVVAHLSAAMARLASAGGTAVVNVCTGQAVSVRALAEVLAASLGRTARLSCGPARIGDIRHSLGDPSRASALLGVRARVPLAAGVATLVQARVAVAAVG
jgi:UDP-glucose 4-epimerase